MRKSLVACASAVLAAVVCLTGCKLSNAQVKAIAQQAGIASAAMWIGIDNPTIDQKIVANDVVGIIKTNASIVASGASYYVVLNPVISTYIDKNVQDQYKPIAKLAGGWVLTGVDTFFAMYPQYASNTTFAAEVVGAYCDGASIALAMSSDDPVIKAATRGSVDGAKVRKALK